jgi:hypothetical protein
MAGFPDSAAVERTIGNADNANIPTAAANRIRPRKRSNDDR